MNDDLAALFSRPTTTKVLVVGDLILDRYIWGNAERISPEAPVLILRADVEEVRLGGAASVAYLLQALKCPVILAGVTGADSAGRVMRALLTEAGIDHVPVLCDPGRISTAKERFIGRAANRHPNQILRVDREVRDPLPQDLETALIAAIILRMNDTAAILVADYAKGVCSPRLLKEVVAAASDRGLPVFVDPARIADYSCYKGATMLVPNRAETELATGLAIHTPADAAAAGKLICETYGFPMVLVKLDKDGMVLVRNASALAQAGERFTRGLDGRPGIHTQHFPARRRTVYDVTGAGDMVLAMAGLCHVCGLSLPDTVPLANAAAGLEVEQMGVAPIGRAEICAELLGDDRRKIMPLPQLVKIVERVRNLGKKIVFTNGCFDLLHVGHITYLMEAARLGDFLIVAVNSDASVRRLKGPHRPVFVQSDRAKMLASLGCVDHVIVFDEDTPHALLHAVRPDFLVKGGTYTPDEVVGHEVVQSYGGKVEVLSLVEGVSTTKIIGAVVSKGQLCQ